MISSARPATSTQLPLCMLSELFIQSCDALPACLYFFLPLMEKRRIDLVLVVRGRLSLTVKTYNPATGGVSPPRLFRGVLNQVLRLLGAERCLGQRLENHPKQVGVRFTFDIKF
jgi:hypothetical protein